MNVEVDGSDLDFAHSVGMMGEFGTGEMLDRNGNPMVKDPKDIDTMMTAYGMEWQVRPGSDPQLFSKMRAPQWPEEKCRVPGASAATKRRNLRSDLGFTAQAERA